MAVYTVVKTIGTSQNYSTPSTWEADGDVNLTTAEKSACTTFLTGTFTTAMTLTFVGSGATGKVLETDSTGPGTGTYMVYSITSGNPAASDVITGTGGSPPTCVLTSGTPDNVGVIWQGQMINQQFTVNTSGLTLSGATSSSTCYKELRCVAGASFSDNVSVQSNALRYNSSNGASITGISGGGALGQITLSESYCRMTGVQVEKTGTGNACSVVGNENDSRIANCIIEGVGDNTQPLVLKPGIALNCLFVSRLAARDSLVSTSRGSQRLTNCTFVTPSDLTAGTTAIVKNSGYALNLTNCASFGFTTFLTGTGGLTVSTCKGDSSQSLSGYTASVAYDTSTGSGFQNTSDATRDFRIKSTSSLVDTGTTDATWAPSDIAGTARPSGSAYDVGAWEYVSAGATLSMVPRRGGASFRNLLSM